MLLASGIRTATNTLPSETAKDAIRRYHRKNWPNDHADTLMGRVEAS
jgi:hypothetical protein